jgi:ubiquinone/menaquinone biosynthesis C-methylase UbiE
MGPEIYLTVDFAAEPRRIEMATTETDTASHFRLGDYLLGIEGLAILRAAQRHQFDSLERRRQEAQGILGGYDQRPLSDVRDLPEADVNEGYTTWSQTYDHPTDPDPDPIQALEGPAMRKLIDELPDGPVLDAACGTGRHTAYLVEKGHEVLGVDANEAMLAKAREKVPGAEFRVGDLADLPVEDRSYGAITCGLGFSHLQDIEPAIEELARVVRPGGRVAISAPHSFITAVLGWRAPVFDAEGNGWEMPEYEHLHGEYVEAFDKAGLVPKRCLEPRLTEEMARWNPEAAEGEENPFAEALETALAGQPGVFVWVAEKPEA